MVKIKVMVQNERVCMTSIQWFPQAEINQLRAAARQRGATVTSMWIEWTQEHTFYGGGGDVILSVEGRGSPAGSADWGSPTFRVHVPNSGHVNVKLPRNMWDLIFRHGTGIRFAPARGGTAGYGYIKSGSLRIHTYYKEQH